MTTIDTSVLRPPSHLDRIVLDMAELEILDGTIETAVQGIDPLHDDPVNLGAHWLLMKVCNGCLDDFDRQNLTLEDGVVRHHALEEVAFMNSVLCERAAGLIVANSLDLMNPRLKTWQRIEQKVEELANPAKVMALLVYCQQLRELKD